MTNILDFSILTITGWSGTLKYSFISCVDMKKHTNRHQGYNFTSNRSENFANIYVFQKFAFSTKISKK